MHECLVVLALQALSPAECVVNVVLDAMANKDTSVVEAQFWTRRRKGACDHH
jgi:hypothetical protein